MAMKYWMLKLIYYPWHWTRLSWQFIELQCQVSHFVCDVMSLHWHDLCVSVYVCVSLQALCLMAVMCFEVIVDPLLICHWIFWVSLPSTEDWLLVGTKPGHLLLYRIKKDAGIKKINRMCDAVYLQAVSTYWVLLTGENQFWLCFI